MRYFTHFSSYNMPKNKLQQAIVNHFKDLDGLIVDDIKVWTIALQSVLDRLNTEFKKCSSLTLGVWQNSNGVTFGFHGDWTCNIYLYTVKENR